MYLNLLHFLGLKENSVKKTGNFNTERRHTFTVSLCIYSRSATSKRVVAANKKLVASSENDVLC